QQPEPATSSFLPIARVTCSIWSNDRRIINGDAALIRISRRMGWQKMTTEKQMRPVDLQCIGNQLAVRWSDGAESFITLEALRRACPCAECKGETDIMGNLHRNPPKPLTGKSF